MEKREPIHSLGINPAVAGWLREQEQAIIADWFAAVEHSDLRPDLAHHHEPGTQEISRAQLIGFFRGIVAAVDTGSVSCLNAAIQTLVDKQLGQNYGLNDFLNIANKLKNGIWKSAQASLKNDRMLEILVALEPVFFHNTMRLAWLANRAANERLEEQQERIRHTSAKLDRTKSDFISIAAHELKTPLTLVKGYTAILSSEMAGQSSIDRVLQGLNSGVKRLQALIQAMIDVSLIDSAVLALSLQPVSLQEIVNLAVDDVQQEAANRHLTIRVQDFPPDVNAVFLDAKRMYQVFTNLVGNAVKYTPDQGRIEVSARVLSEPELGLRFVEVSIADNGIGIKPDDLAVIFDKFYRAGESDLHSTSNTEFKGGGPGLGLPIAKGIVEAHGGRVWAESPGYSETHCPGSTFRIMLPLNTELPESPSERLLGLERD
jgi:signal transduction histidine kinase